MTMRESYEPEPTTTMDPVDTDIGSGAPPEYAGRDPRDVDLREDRDGRDWDRAPYRDERAYPRERMRYADPYDRDGVDDRRRMRHYDDDDGPGFADEAARFARRHLRTPETKEFFKTSEFFVTILGALMMMLAAGVHETFDAEDMWPLVTALFGLYVLSRGIAKAGTAHHEPRRRSPERW